MRRSYGSLRRDRRQVTAMIAVVMLLHVLGFGALVLLVAPGNGSQALSVGLGFSAYMFGLQHRHRCRPHRRDRQRHPQAGSPTVAGPGRWGSGLPWGIPGMVLVLALLVLTATKAANGLLDDSSPVRHVLGMAGTLASGGFLYIIAVVNVIALVGIWRRPSHRRAAVASMRRSLRNSWTAVGCWPASCARSPAASPRRVRCSASGHCSGWDSTPRRRWRCWRWRGPGRPPARSLVRGAHLPVLFRGGYGPDGQC